MPRRLPVFHIGANKAGSTTLQRALFARHSEVLNLAKPAPVAEAAQAVAVIVKTCDSRQKISPATDRDEIRQLWRQAVAAAEIDGRVPVFSHEELIRYYLYGEPDPERLPKAIVAMAGPLRVAIVVRHQVKLIESLYIHKANSSNFLTAEKWLASQPEWFAYGYRFYEIAEAWMRIVGEENVGVFVFEEMAKDSASFARRLCDFVGIDAEMGVQLLARQHENVRKSERTQKYAKLRSAVLPDISLGNALPAPLRGAWRNFLEAGPPARIELPPIWLSRIEDYYGLDNRKLAERFHLPLRHYGYPM
ncbi:MAG: sulfotransferase [Candidatus Binatia bacterium]